MRRFWVDPRKAVPALLRRASVLTRWGRQGPRKRKEGPSPCTGVPAVSWHVGTPQTPEERGRPPRSYLLGAERGNPVGVRPLAGRPDVRRAQPPAGHEDPTSESHLPKGKG